MGERRAEPGKLLKEPCEAEGRKQTPTVTPVNQNSNGWLIDPRFDALLGCDAVRWASVRGEKEAARRAGGGKGDEGSRTVSAS